MHWISQVEENPQDPKRNVSKHERDNRADVGNDAAAPAATASTGAKSNGGSVSIRGRDEREEE